MSRKWLLPLAALLSVSVFGIWLFQGQLQEVDVSLAHPAETALQGIVQVDRGTAPDLFTGAGSCTECHEEQYRQWRGSHHDLAMQVADETSVLGDFNDAEFSGYTITSRFYRDGDRFMVLTDGPDGTMQNYEITYTFGVTPLQQYLIELPGGRLQALGIAWDSRSIEQGGQRWFHLYPEEQIAHDDQLHWTALNQNWNYMCAECHSTNLKKNYDAAADKFRTSWSEINVACEACHGPGSKHIIWANGTQEQRAQDPGYGLSLALNERHNVTWPVDVKTAKVARSVPRTTEIEIDMCARCHSRRGVVTEEYLPGDKFMDTHRPAFLSDGLYYPDGQILEEVYVYGSFRQSKMYHAGVTCGDCHEAHSLQLRGTRETVCLQCHLSEKYAAPSHHFHLNESPGASCVGCHMPEKTYMVVDPRFDHSMRIPRPDLSIKMGVPNACNQCHIDQTNEWSTNYIRQWYPQPAAGFQEYADALAAGRKGDPEAAGLLIELLARENQPAIARGTALTLLSQFPVPQSIQVISDSLYDTDPAVRLGGAMALEGMQPNIRYQLGAHLLNDPIRIVRIEAARVLATTPFNQLDPEKRAILDRAVNEYQESLNINAERPEALVNMGNLFTRFERFGEAEQVFLGAIKADRQFPPSYVNLADLYRVMGREQDALNILNQGLVYLPEEAGLYNALGLALVRSHQLPAAVEALRKAAELAKDDVHYSYIYAVGLDAEGKTLDAIEVLKDAYERNSNAQPVLSALIVYLQKVGETTDAEKYQVLMNKWQQRFTGALQSVGAGG